MASGTIPRKSISTTTVNIELATNANVSPFATYGTGSINIPSGYLPVILTTYGTSSTNPTSVRINGVGSITAYGKSTGTLSVVVGLLPI